MQSKLFTWAFLCLFALPLMGQMKNLSFKFNHTVNGLPLELDKTVFSIHNGKKVKITRADFYLSGITLFNNNQDSFKIEKSYVLSSAYEPDKIHAVGEYPHNFSFNKLKMEVGLDEETNHADPSPYPASHPLGPKNPDMHWGWAGGYRFIALEGFVDSNGDDIPENTFQFHGLGDELLFSSILTLPENHHPDSEVLVISLDYNKLFNSIAMTGNLIHHNSGKLNSVILLNAAQGGFMTPASTSSIENTSFDAVAAFSQNNREIQLDFDHDENQKVISIFDTSGKEIKSLTTNASFYSTTLDTELSGNYIITVFNGHSKVAKQFFIH
jgi:hypothetical protein